jgi:tripartite-type tricarboxylate transporter receptor subunit TctC
LKAFGTGGTKRSAVLPDVPTIAAAGVPGYDASNWWGVLGPAAIPGSIVNRLNAEIATIMSLPETRKRFAAEGAEPLILTADAFGKLIMAEMTKWHKVAKEARIRAE